MPRTLFCFGVGYTAQALADDLRREGWTLRGTTRDAAKARALGDSGIEAFVLDHGRPLPSERALAGVTNVLSSVPPDEAGDPVLEAHAGDLIARASRLSWVGYLSTTGVYGDRTGGWVDEASALTPATERGRRRVAAEERWRALWTDHGVPVHVFRLAGIYGPGRNALTQASSGTARRVVKPGQVFSRIHVADIVQVLRASMSRPEPGAVYNVADDAPAPPQDVVAHACHLLDVQPPPEVPFDEAQLSPIARSFYAESKRVANTRIKTELGVKLIYPDYRAGLAALATD